MEESLNQMCFLVSLLMVFLGMQILTLSGARAISFVFNPMAFKFEIGFLGVLGKPENRRPAGEKIRDPIFRGARETGEPKTS